MSIAIQSPPTISIERAPLHCLDYGDPGAGKTHFAATFPKPMCVFCFDPYGKDTPYRNRGVAGDFEYDDLGTPILRIYSKRDQRLLIQIEYFHDTQFIVDANGQGNPKARGFQLGHVAPEAYERFLLRMHRFGSEYDQWATVVVDSVTTMEIAARCMFQYKINPSANDPRQWWASSTETLEQILVTRFGGFPTNVVVLAHVDKETDEVLGTRVRNPLAPGRLRGALGGAYQEFYHHFVRVQKDANNRVAGEREYLLQTRGDMSWNSSTQINAPDPCIATYEALWANSPAA